MSACWIYESADAWNPLDAVSAVMLALNPINSPLELILPDAVIFPAPGCNVDALKNASPATTKLLVAVTFAVPIPTTAADAVDKNSDCETPAGLVVVTSRTRWFPSLINNLPSFVLAPNSPKSRLLLAGTFNATDYRFNNIFCAILTSSYVLHIYASFNDYMYSLI